MTIITARRIAQSFFFGLFIWFCIVSTLGTQWWQLRGWPVNWFLQLDPLAGLGVLLATHTLYAGLLWGLATIVLTLFLGRFFCGWVCPMGALQQFVGFLGGRRQKLSRKVAVNQPHRAQGIKYWLLIFLLAAAAADLLHFLIAGPLQQAGIFWGLVLLVAVWAGLMAAFNYLQIRPATIMIVLGLVAAGVALQWRFDRTNWLAATLQTGLLDPIALMQRSVNLAIVPLLDAPVRVTAVNARFYQGAGLIGLSFGTVILLCLRAPRFYCRFICPLGALFGLLSRWAVWRIGKSEDRCRQCRQCEAHCEGACAPSGVIQISECVLCLNCMDQCRHGLMGYRPQPSATGERMGPDLSRRQVVTALAGGLALAPVLRIDGRLADNWNPRLIRPPGALPEPEFLSRCIKCGQCMRICPTNVIHPAAGWQAGVEGIWTPVLNFRSGTSGCQHNCVACSHVCPTAALRPLTVMERMGRDRFADAGPIRTGMAFVDRGRCLPWAMDTPCIVCQENCPVSPKAIFTRAEFQTVRDGLRRVKSVNGNHIEISGDRWPDLNLVGGDYYLAWAHADPRLIVAAGDIHVIVAETMGNDPLPESGDPCRIVVRLQKPHVDLRRCIGCGVCEHECPVQGRRAIRISAENESRHPKHRMVL